MKPINAEEIVRVFNGWLEEADSLAEREAIECRIAEKREVVNAETGEAISSNIGITYWKHPETPDCVLGFGMFFLDTPDDIQRWNSRTDKAESNPET